MPEQSGSRAAPLSGFSEAVRAFAATALLANGNVSCLRSGVKLASQLHSRALKALPLPLNDSRRPLSPQIRNGHAGLREQDAGWHPLRSIKLVQGVPY